MIYKGEMPFEQQDDDEQRYEPLMKNSQIMTP